jgi:hypothetical protein
VFIIYDSNKTNASAIRKAHNDMHPAIQYKYEEEQNNRISFFRLGDAQGRIPYFDRHPQKTYLHGYNDSF